MGRGGFSSHGSVGMRSPAFGGCTAIRNAVQASVLSPLRNAQSGVRRFLPLRRALSVQAFAGHLSARGASIDRVFFSIVSPFYFGYYGYPAYYC